MTRDNSAQYQMPYVFVTDPKVEDFFEQRTGFTLERYAAAQECYFLAGLDSMKSILIDTLNADFRTGVSKNALNEYRQLKKTVTDLTLLNVRKYHLYSACVQSVLTAHQRKQPAHTSSREFTMNTSPTSPRNAVLSLTTTLFRNSKVPPPSANAT